MKKALAKGLLVIIEAGVEVLAERIKKRRMQKDGSYRKLAHFPYGCGVYGVRDRSAAHFPAMGHRRSMRKRNTLRRSISKERQKT